MDIPATNATSDPQTVLAALKNAAAATGSDFHYLLGTAMRESSLKPDAHSSTSSAAGLFQFVDQTWMGLVKVHGAQYGLGGMADAIRKGDDGRFHADAADRQAILSLRANPQVSALMAGEYAKTTQNQMRATLGREVCGGELYAAHFLGPDAACKLIRLADNAPGASAAAQFPDAAHANKSVFYRPDGQAKTVKEVYDWALRQPGEPDTARAAAVSRPSVAAAPTRQSATVAVAAAGDSEIRMLLASVMNWQPGQGFFQAGAPQSGALSLNAGLLNLLSDSKT
jgi:Transglycosylase SLT domain